MTRWLAKTSCERRRAREKAAPKLRYNRLLKRSLPRGQFTLNSDYRRPPAEPKGWFRRFLDYMGYRDDLR